MKEPQDVAFKPNLNLTLTLTQKNTNDSEFPYVLFSDKM